MWFWKDLKRKFTYRIMADLSIPGYGGLMRYKEEYNSKLKFGPGVVVGAVIISILLVIGLRWIFPLS